MDVEEIGIQLADLAELLREDFVGVFALVDTVPGAFSAKANHDCWGDGVWSVGLRCGKLGGWNCLMGVMWWC